MKLPASVARRASRRTSTRCSPATVWLAQRLRCPAGRDEDGYIAYGLFAKQIPLFANTRVCSRSDRLSQPDGI